MSKSTGAAPKVLAFIEAQPGRDHSVGVIAASLGMRVSQVRGALSVLSQDGRVRKTRVGVWRAAGLQTTVVQESTPCLHPCRPSSAAALTGELLEIRGMEADGAYLIAQDTSGESWCVLRPDRAAGLIRIETLFGEMMRIVATSRQPASGTPPRRAEQRPDVCKTGVRLVQLRDTHGYTLDELAIRITRVAPKSRLDGPTLRRLEEGRRPLTRDEIVELSRAYSKRAVELDSFLHGTALYTWD